MMLESPQLKMLEQLSWKLRSRRRWATCQHVQHGQQEQEEHHKTACECRKRCEIKQQSHEVENRLWFVDIVLINEPKLSKMAMEAQNNDKDIQSPNNTLPPISNNLGCFEAPLFVRWGIYDKTSCIHSVLGKF